MKKLFLIYSLFFVSCLTFDVLHVYSQQPTLEWVRRYPDTVYSLGAVGYAMALDSGGNVYVTGALGATVYCTIKYSPSGEPLWLNNFTGSNYGGRQAYAVAVDKNSNTYVSGYSYNPGTSFDYCTIKYDTKGIQQWVEYYDGPSHGIDQVQKIAVDNAANIYVTGFSSEGGMVDFQIATIKYSPDGRQIWVQRYGTNDASTYANGLAVDDSCNIYITGANNSKAVTLKYDSSGILKWVQVYEGGFGSQANALALDNNNNVCITGFSYGVVGRHIDCFTVKYSAVGVQLWERRYNPDSTIAGRYCSANSIALDTQNNVYLGASAGSSYGTIKTKFCTIKFSADGNIVWDKTDSTNLTNSGPFITIDKDNYVYLAGISYDTIPNNLNYTIIKYNRFGSTIFKEFFLGIELNDIKIDKNYDIYLTGYGVGGILTLKYSQPIGIKPISIGIPKNFELRQNYPNPFNPKTVIKFQVSSYRFVNLAIYDILGRRVATLVNENLKPGEYETQWDASNYASGVYFYTLEAGNFVETKKMGLIK